MRITFGENKVNCMLEKEAESREANVAVDVTVRERVVLGNEGKVPCWGFRRVAAAVHVVKVGHHDGIGGGGGRRVRLGVLGSQGLRELIRTMGQRDH